MLRAKLSRVQSSVQSERSLALRQLLATAQESLDKVDNSAEKKQAGEVTIAGEVDRIYNDVSNTLIIDDKALDRCIQILSQGNKTAVVWNPWEKIAKDMADLEDADYQRFICVETTNAASDVIGIAPGCEFRLVADYRVMR